MPFAGDLNGGPMARFLCALAAGLSCFFCGSAWRLQAADLDEGRQHFIQGHYSDCIRLCEQALGDQEYSEEWRLLLIDCFMTVGRYTNALTVVTANMERYPSSLRLRLGRRPRSTTGLI